MNKRPKYLYADDLLESGKKPIFLIRDEKEPSGILSGGADIKTDNLCETLEIAITHLKDNGYRVPSQKEIEMEIHNAIQEGLDYINLKIDAI